MIYEKKTTGGSLARFWMGFWKRIIVEEIGFLLLQIT